MKERSLAVEAGTSKTKRCNKRLKYPIIRLKGNWLKEAGIEYGQRVSVTINEKCLIIKPL